MKNIKIPIRYLPKKLTKKDKKKQKTMLLRSKKMYKKGKYYTRKRLPSFTSKKSSHITDAMKIYNIKKVVPNKELAQKTGCSLSALKQIVKKGEGAYYSSGSRPNQTAQSWGLARLASSMTSGKAAAVDYNIIEKGCDHSKKAFRLANQSRKKYKYGHSRNKKTTLNGGVRTYDLNGKITNDPEILHDDKDFFRKMTQSKNEIEICKILMNHPHKNIIQMYDIGKDYVDMELLNTNIYNVDIGEIKRVMSDVKSHLQSLGIMYIDWKLDNIGISSDGELKLFDFDVSGVINNESGEWIIEPPKSWSYKNAIKNGMENPVDIDNFLFNLTFGK